VVPEGRSYECVVPIGLHAATCNGLVAQELSDQLQNMKVLGQLNNYHFLNEVCSLKVVGLATTFQGNEYVNLKTFN
jgi:hypothetical protein